MPFPLFSNPFHKPNNSLSSSTRFTQHSNHNNNPNPNTQTHPTHHPTKSIISHQPNHSTSSTTTNQPVLKPIVLNTNSPTSSAISHPEPITSQRTSIRTRTQSLAATHSKIRTSSSSRPATASQDPSFKSESTQLIKKLKSYGSTTDKALPSPKKSHPRPPPLKLSNQTKSQHIRTHRPSESLAQSHSPSSPRSRSASAAATVFDIVRPSRRRDGTQNLTTITPFTPPLPIPPLIFSVHQPIDPSQRDRIKSNRLPPSPLSIPHQFISRPRAPRRASSLDSITTGFPAPHSPHQQYLKNAGFLQTSRKLSPWTGGLSHSESTEEIITPPSRPNTAQTTPLSTAPLRSRFSPRDNRQLAPHSLKPRLVSSSSRMSLSPKSPFPSKLGRSGEPHSPKLLDPVEITSSVSLASWTVNVSGSSTFEPITTCLVPDLPGTILRLKHGPKELLTSQLEPQLQKIIKIGANGHELVEWELRLAVPIRPRLDSSPSNYSSPNQPSPRIRNPSKSKTPHSRFLLSNEARLIEQSGGCQLADVVDNNNSHAKSNMNPSSSVIKLNLNTFRASDLNDATTLPARDPSHVSNDPTQPPSSLSSLFPSTLSPGKFEDSIAQARSPSPSSPISSASSSFSLAEDDNQDTEDDGRKIQKRYRRKRLDTYVAPVTPGPAQPSYSDYISNHHPKVEAKPRRNLIHAPKTSYQLNRKPQDENVRMSDDQTDRLMPQTFNLERQLAHSKLLGITGEQQPISSTDRSPDSSKDGPADDLLDFNKHHFHRPLTRNSNSHHNSYFDRNSVVEKSYWSETDTTTSSIVNFRIINEDEDVNHLDDH